jgi:hypothetical protein
VADVAPLNLGLHGFQVHACMSGFQVLQHGAGRRTELSGELQLFVPRYRSVVGGWKKEGCKLNPYIRVDEFIAI